jgi:hypothetical protein
LKIHFTWKLQQLRKNLEIELEGPPKFRAGTTTLLDHREQHIEEVVTRIRLRASKPQPNTSVKVASPISAMIDLSDLVPWGVSDLSDPAFEVDFVALDFTIQRTTPEPATNSVGKLVMKKMRKDDETSS